MAEVTQCSAEPAPSDVRLVIAASSMGTIFEWYDFFIYGTLAAIVGKTFFPSGNETLETLLVWAGFAVGFGFRPLGAILFGYLGDRLGRKYTFLVTVTLMGIATAGVGFTPSVESIGLAAPAIVMLLRVLQGLALGGEYGGAAVYVSEHSTPSRRGFFTGFIQASVVGGFVLSLVVVLGCKTVMSSEVWNAWGWRVPFLLSMVLLAISLWMRLKLSESPVFRAMRHEGKLATNPFAESFAYPGNKQRILVALFGVSAGITVIWYTSMFSALGFLKGAMRLNETWAEAIVGFSAAVGMIFYIIFGSLSDRIGRKQPIICGYLLTLLLLFPAYWTMGAYANPALASASDTAPISLVGPDCEYRPFASEQPTSCGKLMSDLTGAGVTYRVSEAPELVLQIGGRAVPIAAYPWADHHERIAMLQSWLADAGYSLDRVEPSATAVIVIALVLIGLMALSGATFGPVAALLCEMFPARIRYSSMSIPYHVGTGYFGGFLPLISSYVIAKSGNPYQGLWYTWVVVAVALVVSLWGLPSGPPRDFGEDAT